MKLSRSLVAATVGVAALLGATTTVPASAETVAATNDPAPRYEEHRFSGSFTSARAFQAWFDGGEFVQPEIETMDLRELKVNETQVAHAGDIIYKDENGHFWIKPQAK